MSWCRWSSMEFDCDLYVYESVEGIEVHVAKLRLDIDRDALPPGGELCTAECRARQEALRRAIDIATHYPIGLPHDGETRIFDELSEAADWIDQLAELGYHIPPGMTAQMRSEAKP